MIGWKLKWTGDTDNFGKVTKWRQTNDAQCFSWIIPPYYLGKRWKYWLHNRMTTGLTDVQHQLNTDSLSNTSRKIRTEQLQKCMFQRIAHVCRFNVFSIRNKLHIFSYDHANVYARKIISHTWVRSWNNHKAQLVSMCDYHRLRCTVNRYFVVLLS